MREEEEEGDVEVRDIKEEVQRQQSQQGGVT